jgi:hypothetical protein
VLDSELFLTPSEFAWAAWRAEAHRLVRDPAAIRDADLLTIRRLLASLWHQDRVSGGTFSSACSHGVMLAILQRLQVNAPTA